MALRARWDPGDEESEAREGDSLPGCPDQRRLAPEHPQALKEPRLAEPANDLVRNRPRDPEPLLQVPHLARPQPGDPAHKLPISPHAVLPSLRSLFSSPMSHQLRFCPRNLNFTNPSPRSRTPPPPDPSIPDTPPRTTNDPDLETNGERAGSLVVRARTACGQARSWWTDDPGSNPGTSPAGASTWRLRLRLLQPPKALGGRSLRFA